MFEVKKAVVFHHLGGLRLKVRIVHSMISFPRFSTSGGTLIIRIETNIRYQSKIILITWVLPMLNNGLSN